MLLFNIQVAIVFCPFKISDKKIEVLHDPSQKSELDVGQALPSSAIR